MNKQQIESEIARLNNISKKQQESGVNLIGYNRLKFKEHIWNKSPTIKSERAVNDKVFKEWEYPSDELVSMVYVVTKVDEFESYFVKNKYRQCWEAFGTKTAVYEKLFNDYQDFEYESIDQDKIYKMDVNKIRLLVYGKANIVTGNDDLSTTEVHVGTIPSVYTSVNYPMKDEFMCSDTGQFVINIGSAYETKEGVADYKKASKIIRIIYRSLCSYPALKDDAGVPYSDEEEEFELYRKVMDNQYTDEEKDFKFVMSWCAALIQRPGVNLMTNIWFAGEYQGIGKGTLVNLLKFILGKDRVGRCKPNMITGSFNSQLDSKFLLEINEKQQGISPMEMTNWLKGFSQEADILIEKKGIDVFTRINMINVIGTAQTPEDVFHIEDEDRRNVIFKTVAKDSDPNLYWRKYAKNVATGLEHGDGWGEAFAFVLERVDVDWNLISTSYQTRGYASVKSIQMSSSNPLYLWALSEFDNLKTAGPYYATEMRQYYLNDNPKSNISQNKFNKCLKELIGAQGIIYFKLSSPGNKLRVEF